MTLTIFRKWLDSWASFRTLLTRELTGVALIASETGTISPAPGRIDREIQRSSK
jgi:hypothetical protein